MSESTEETFAEFKIFGIEATVTKEVIVFMVVIFTLVSVVRLLYDKTRMKAVFPESTLLVLIGLAIGTIIALPKTEASL